MRVVLAPQLALAAQTATGARAALRYGVILAVAAVFLGYRCEAVEDAILVAIGIGVGQLIVWRFVWFPGEADVLVIERMEVDRG